MAKHGVGPTTNSIRTELKDRSVKRRTIKSARAVDQKTSGRVDAVAAAEIANYFLCAEGLRRGQQQNGGRQKCETQPFCQHESSLARMPLSSNKHFRRTKH